MSKEEVGVRKRRDHTIKDTNKKGMLNNELQDCAR
jgi:hypothetical protein